LKELAELRKKDKNIRKKEEARRQKQELTHQRTLKAKKKIYKKELLKIRIEAAHMARENEKAIIY
jgi:hypothetical protein